MSQRASSQPSGAKISSTPTSLAPSSAENKIKIFRPGKIVILLNGRYAGHKAMIVNPFEGNPSKTRPFSHALVVGIKRAPLPVTKSMSKRKIRSRCRVRTFIKVINYNHLMPTRYSIDLDLKNIVNLDIATDSSKRKEACTIVGKRLEEKYKVGGSKWFFSKLRF